MSAGRPSWHHDGRSARERGYGYAWQKLRKQILARDGYRCQCQDCRAPGAPIKPATHVDHIVSKADWLRQHGNLDRCDDPTNLRAINKDCHALKSASERGFTLRMGSAADGMPLDPGHHWHAEPSQAAQAAPARTKTPGGESHGESDAPFETGAPGRA